MTAVRINTEPFGFCEKGQEVELNRKVHLRSDFGPIVSRGSNDTGPSSCGVLCFVVQCSAASCLVNIITGPSCLVLCLLGCVPLPCLVNIKTGPCCLLLFFEVFLWCLVLYCCLVLSCLVLSCLVLSCRMHNKHDHLVLCCILFCHVELCCSMLPCLALST
jgi:hypothetical protein